jgi:hypothetical protein
VKVPSDKPIQIDGHQENTVNDKEEERKKMLVRQPILRKPFKFFL